MDKYSLGLIMISLCLLYFFFETRIVLVLWIALLNFIRIAHRLLSLEENLYKVVITVFILSVLSGYVYKFRRVLFYKETIENKKLKRLQEDKKLQSRLVIAAVMTLLISIVIIGMM